MSNWDKITTRDFIRIREIIYNHTKDGQLHKLVWMQVKVLEIVTKYTYDELKAMDYDKVRDLCKKYEWAFTYPAEELITTSFKFNGRKFDAVLSAYKIKAEQFIDGTELSKGTELDMIRNLNILLGILIKERKVWYRPFRKMLTDEERYALVLDMPISLVYPNVVFFYLVWENLLPSIKDYLVDQAEELTAIAHGMLNDGGGQ